MSHPLTVEQRIAALEDAVARFEKRVAPHETKHAAQNGDAEIIRRIAARIYKWTGIVGTANSDMCQSTNECATDLLGAIRSGDVVLPDDTPQIAALMQTCAEWEKANTTLTERLRLHAGDVQSLESEIRNLNERLKDEQERAEKAREAERVAYESRNAAQKRCNAANRERYTIHAQAFTLMKLLRNIRAAVQDEAWADRIDAVFKRIVISEHVTCEQEKEEATNTTQVNLNDGKIWLSAHYKGEEVWGSGDTIEQARTNLEQAIRDAKLFCEDDPVPDWTKITDAVGAHGGQPAPMDKRRFESAPCYICGYSGPGYFQPSVHHCAAEYHAVPPPKDDSPPPQSGQPDGAADVCPSEERMRGWSRKEYISHVRHVWGKVADLRAKLEQATAQADHWKAQFNKQCDVEDRDGMRLLALTTERERLRAEADALRAECAKLKGRKVVPFDFLMHGFTSVKLWEKLRGLPWAAKSTPDDIWGMCKGITETIAEPICRAATFDAARGGK